MPCYHPLDAWYSREVNPSGKRGLVWNLDLALDRDKPIKIACGQCIGCRLEYSREWAVRGVHESRMWPRNCFITLTYSPSRLPANGSLYHRHFQLLMYRLRKRYGKGIRYFMCGEYGELGGRPHYHAILFNFDFKDKVPFDRSGRGDQLYRSEELDELWKDEYGNVLGFTSVGECTFETIAYVARYVTKKQSGRGSSIHYEVPGKDGEIVGSRRPEYCTSSRRPGLGRPFIEANHGVVYFSDEIVMRDGKKCSVPKAYDRWYKEHFPVDFDDIVFKRVHESKMHACDSTPERLAVREYCQAVKEKSIKRSYESET